MLARTGKQFMSIGRSLPEQKTIFKKRRRAAVEGSERSISERISEP
jgi:hypothetical protein